MHLYLVLTLMQTFQIIVVTYLLCIEMDQQNLRAEQKRGGGLSPLLFDHGCVHAIVVLEPRNQHICKGVTQHRGAHKLVLTVLSCNKKCSYEQGEKANKFTIIHNPKPKHFPETTLHFQHSTHLREHVHPWLEHVLNTAPSR